jgi:predicted O-methyltransferase YrrM
VSGLGRLLPWLLPAPVMRDKSLFLHWERRGYHVTPVHFYEPIPDTRMLKPALWSTPSECVGVVWRDADQVQLLEQFAENLRHEYEAFPLSNAAGYYVDNPLYSTVDGEILYCMIRTLKPGRIIEIGSGFSTLLAAEASRENQRQDPERRCELIAIDPFPKDELKNKIVRRASLVQKPVQDVPLSLFADLQANDILFIDSTHIATIGSDVCYEILEILPRLKRGVAVQFHDIFLPWQYPSHLIDDHFVFWNEQYLLHAFLAFNDEFEIMWSSNFMDTEHPELLDSAFSRYVPGETRASSLWIRRRRGGGRSVVSSEHSP